MLKDDDVCTGATASNNRAGTCDACPQTKYKNGIGDGVCMYMPLQQQELLVAEYLISESHKRPYCIPGILYRKTSLIRKYTIYSPPGI
jgi:hypothetical protein